jgi:beta-lactamase class D
MRAHLLGVMALASLSVLAAQEPAPTFECFLWARSGGSPVVSNTAECAVPTSPASTFKIPHALIALETGVVTPATVLRWDGTAHEFPGWRADHTLETAIHASVLPFFRQTAKAIGRERMTAQLRAFAYSGDTFEGTGDFWVNGDLEVSALEQLAFVQRFFDGTLPVSKANLAMVRDALRMPAGEVLLAGGPQPFVLDWPGVMVRAKAGNTLVRGERVSWLVGAVDADGIRHLFAARARSAGALPPTAGAEVARRGLNALGRR